MNKIVIPKNELKEKVGKGGFSEDKVKSAQSAIDDNQIDFSPIALQYLAAMNESLQELQKSQDYQSAHSSLLDVLTQLRAQGSMFHFSAMTAITDVVVDLLDSVDEIDAKVIEIVKAYEKSAQLLIKNGIKSSEHNVCKALAAELKSTCAKYIKKNSAAD